MVSRGKPVIDPRYFVLPQRVSVVVHTHPPRVPHLQVLRDSIAASDIAVFRPDYEICVEPDGLGHYEKLLHWLMMLLRHARLGPYVLCLEDDIVVNRHILHNLCSWPALEDPQFGMGTAFVNDPVLNYPPLIQTPYGWRRERQRTPMAQAHFYKSDILHRATKIIWEVLRKKKYSGDKLDDIAYQFDLNITMSVGALRRRVYVHRPSLVDCSEVAMVEALTARRPKGKGSKRIADHQVRTLTQIQHRALDFDPDWRRET